MRGIGREGFVRMRQRVPHKVPCVMGLLQMPAPMAVMLLSRVGGSGLIVQPATVHTEPVFEQSFHEEGWGLKEKPCAHASSAARTTPTREDMLWED